MKKAEPKKYVVVLAHADGWGAHSANRLIRHMSEIYPEIGVHLIVTRATKDKEGRIATKINDLRPLRAIKETLLGNFFAEIDQVQDEAHRASAEAFNDPAISAEKMIELGMQLGHTMRVRSLTFKRLGSYFCADGQAHFTSTGGRKGGLEAAAVIHGLEEQYGHGPEVLLSVDTMAILPEELLEIYDCVSLHPGPLDTIKIENMQGTLRAMVNNVLYDGDGNPLSRNHEFGSGITQVKGTMFFQHPVVDKGPPIAYGLTPVCPGMCAYWIRDELYFSLTNLMFQYLPTLLDAGARRELKAEAVRNKVELDKQKSEHIEDLEERALRQWEGQWAPVAAPENPNGTDAIQNELISQDYLYGKMRDFYPGSEEAYRAAFDRHFKDGFEAMHRQRDDRASSGFALLARGRTDVTVRRHDPRTGAVIATYWNDPHTGRARSRIKKAL